MDKAALNKNHEIRDSTKTQMMLRVESRKNIFETIIPSCRTVSALEISNDSQVIKVDANIDINVRQATLKISPRKIEAIDAYDG